MKVIDFMNKKGGVGKTSSSVATSVALANRGFKVIHIDLDPQGNSTSYLARKQQIQFEFADVLMKTSITSPDGEKKQIELADVLLETRIQNLFLLPTLNLNENLKIYKKTLATESPFAMRQIIRKLKELKPDIDFVIMDSSPDMSGLEESALIASDEAIIVMLLDQFSKDGLLSIFRSIQSLQERMDTDRPKMNKLLLNKRDYRLIQHDNIMKEMEGMKQNGFELFVLPVDQSFPKSQEMNVPVQEMSSVKKETLETINELADAIAEGSDD